MAKAAKVVVPALVVANLAKRIEAFGKSAETFHTEAHVLAVSTLHYTANSGRVDMLNLFYNFLSVAHQAAFKQYLTFHKASEFLTRTMAKGFELVKGKDAERKALVAKSAELLAGQPFHAKIKVDRTADAFTDDNVFNIIKGLLAKVHKDNAHVSGPLLHVVESFADKVEKLKPVNADLAKPVAPVQAAMEKTDLKSKLLKAANMRVVPGRTVKKATVPAKETHVAM